MVKSNYPLPELPLPDNVTNLADARAADRAIRILATIAARLGGA